MDQGKGSSARTLSSNRLETKNVRGPSRKRSGARIFTPKQFALKGASPLAGKPCDPYATPEVFISRVPANWRVRRQSLGAGLKFTSPDERSEWRVHGPFTISEVRPDAPGAQGWVLRVTKYDPTHPFASKGKFPGWVSYNSLGQPVPNDSNAAHIPVFGNRAAYDPLDYASVSV